MFKRIIVLAGLFVATIGTHAYAQGVEVSVFGGWTFSDGVTGNAVLAGDGNIYDRIDPKDSGSFGFSVGYLVNHSAEVGFLYSQQFSTLIIGGTAEREVGDLSIKTYHGYFAYNWGEGAVRPFAYVGFGATNFGSVDFTSAAGAARTTGSETQYSTTWGGGVKFFATPHVGARAAISWTPTYIKTDTEGWWCDPYWGCYLVGDPQYSNQFTLSGGVTFKF